MPFGVLDLFCCAQPFGLPSQYVCFARSPPTTIGVFTYLQPIIAIVYASLTGNDQMDGIKTIATLLVFTGVYLVTRKNKTSHEKN